VTLNVALQRWPSSTPMWDRRFADVGTQTRLAPRPERGWEYTVYQGLKFKYAPIQGDFFVGFAEATRRPYEDVVAGFYDFASQWYPRELLTWIPNPSPWQLYGWSMQPGATSFVSTSVVITNTHPTSGWVGWTAPAAATGLTLIESAVQPDARQAFLEALDAEMARAAVHNWDGDGALPIDAGAKTGAVRFINLLGPTFPQPEITPTSGAITFDWYCDPRWIFSVSITDERRVHYAGRFDSTKLSGTEELTGALPEIIDFGIRRASRGRSGEDH